MAVAMRADRPTRKHRVANPPHLVQITPRATGDQPHRSKGLVGGAYKPHAM